MNLSVVCIFVLVLLASNEYVHGQVVSLPDSSRTASGRVRSREEMEVLRKVKKYQRQRDERVFSTPSSSSGSTAIMVLLKKRDKLIDSLTKPTDHEISEHKRTLGRSGAGVVTFLRDSRCMMPIEDADLLLTAQTNCLDRTIPGLGRLFSFRTGEYARVGYADIGVEDNWLFGSGFLTQTILVDLGDFPLDELDLTRPEIKFLTGFVPATSADGYGQQLTELENGVSSHGLQFFDGVKAIAGHTYVLRSIAYRGELLTVVNTGNRKIKFDRLKGDKRGDVIVAFRVVQMEEGGNVRIIWRTLQSKDSPRLKMPVTEINASEYTTIIRTGN